MNKFLVRCGAGSTGLLLACERTVMHTVSECEVELLVAAAKQDVEAARQISYWVGRLLAAYEARRQLAGLPPAQVLDAMRRRP